MLSLDNNTRTKCLPLNNLNVAVWVKKKDHMLLVVSKNYGFHKGWDTHYRPFMYNLELNRLHVNFKFINNLHISWKYGLYNYFKLSARFAFARQHHRVLVLPSSKARWVSRGAISLWTNVDDVTQTDVNGSA